MAIVRRGFCEMVRKHGNSTLLPCSGLCGVFIGSDLCGETAILSKYVCLKTVSVWDRPLSGSQSFYQGASKNIGIGKHDFVMVKLEDGSYIKAEKYKEIENVQRSGIYISCPNRKEVRETKDVSRRRCKFRWSQQMTLSELVIVLTKEHPHYDMAVDNCWRYAYRTCKHLIVATGCSKHDLEPVLKELKAKVKRPMPIAVVCMIIGPFHHMAPRTFRNTFRAIARQRFWFWHW